MKTKVLLSILIVCTLTSSVLAGPSTINCNASPYSSSTNYVLGDQVVYLSASFTHCGPSQTPPSLAEDLQVNDWVFEGSCNAQSTCDARVNWVGGHPYWQGDVVFYNGRLWTANDHHMSNSNLTPQQAFGAGGPGTQGGDKHWTSGDLCDSPCNIEWNPLHYYKATWQVHHANTDQIWEAKWFVKEGQEPSDNIAWKLTDVVCTPPPAPSCYAGDAPDYDPTRTNYTAGERVISNGSLFVHCGEDGCQRAPGFGTDGSNLGCWVWLGSCLGPRDCANATTWDATTWYYDGDRVRHAGRLFEAEKHQVGHDPQDGQYYWKEIEGCNQCETIYNNRYYYKGGWTSVQNGKLYRAKWWVSPNCPPATNAVWELIGTCNGSASPIPGCTSATALNYNSAATQDDGSCVEPVPGCTDSTALNYNSLANTDDGSCVACINGCTDSAANNYNPAANSDDGSCTYDAPADNCDAAAWDCNVWYFPGDIVTFEGRAWEHKNWGKTKNNSPGANIWGVWSLLEWCGPLPNCCAQVPAWSGTKHYWEGQCVSQNGNRYRASINNYCNNPKWAPAVWNKITC